MVTDLLQLNKKNSLDLKAGNIKLSNLLSLMLPTKTMCPPLLLIRICNQSKKQRSEKTLRICYFKREEPITDQEKRGKIITWSLLK
jgi:hypothetical protein